MAVITFSNVPTVQSITIIGDCRQATARASGHQTGTPLSHDWTVRTAETLRQGDCGETAEDWTEAGFETLPAMIAVANRTEEEGPSGLSHPFRVRQDAGGDAPATKIKIVPTDWLDDGMAS